MRTKRNQFIGGLAAGCLIYMGFRAFARASKRISDSFSFSSEDELCPLRKSGAL